MIDIVILVYREISPCDLKGKAENWAIDFYLH
jgi:hypothetical protein